MTDEKKIPDNEDLILAELEAYRMGEEHSKFRLTSRETKVIEDLDKISDLFINARPDSGDISDSVDNVVLAHIKEKGGAIRRDKKVVQLFPRYKWAAAAVMGVLVCTVSFNLVFKKDRPDEKIFNKNIAPVSAIISKEIEGKNPDIVNNNQPARIKFADGESDQNKPGMKMVNTEAYLKNTGRENLEPAPAQTVEDIDGNGRVDIIDAYLMDRRLMSGVNIPKNLDLNGDGNINHEDVNTIGNAAVSLVRGDA